MTETMTENNDGELGAGNEERQLPEGGGDLTQMLHLLLDDRRRREEELADECRRREEEQRYERERHEAETARREMEVQQQMDILESQGPCGRNPKTRRDSSH